MFSSDSKTVSSGTIFAICASLEVTLLTTTDDLYLLESRTITLHVFHP